MEHINFEYHDEYLKTCKECQEEFSGRLNQIFCTSKCKSQYNNRFSRIERNATKDIDKILHVNRNILLSFYEKDPDAKISKRALVDHGFNFKFVTHSEQDLHGAFCEYCYEYGLKKLKDGFHVVKEMAVAV
ncbi:MAG: hypothetical protein IIA45_00695 [Bacteroidetes bacterium]|nr:hypothetical protein [Bacteroidota bacterium]